MDANVHLAASYNETLQRYAREYRAETSKSTATTRELAYWAISTGRWDPPRDLLIQKCREDFAEALREEYIKNEHGKQVRANQVARVVRNGEQLWLWGDIRDIDRNHMQSAVRVKREQMVGECRQVDRDCQFWSSLHPDETPVQCVFNFTDDVEEGRHSGKFVPPDRPR